MENKDMETSHADTSHLDLDSAKADPTPLEKVKAQQAKMENQEAVDHRVESGDEVPGGSKPSDRRKHPQRQLYDGRSSK